MQGGAALRGRAARRSWARQLHRHSGEQLARSSARSSAAPKAALGSVRSWSGTRRRPDGRFLIRGRCGSSGLATVCCLVAARPPTLAPEKLSGELVATERRACLAGSFAGSPPLRREKKSRSPPCTVSLRTACVSHQYYFSTTPCRVLQDSRSSSNQAKDLNVLTGESPPDHSRSSPAATPVSPDAC